MFQYIYPLYQLGLYVHSSLGKTITYVLLQNKDQWARGFESSICVAIIQFHQVVRPFFSNVTLMALCFHLYYDEVLYCKYVPKRIPT